MILPTSDNADPAHFGKVPARQRSATVRPKVIVLDDYQAVARSSTDWSAVAATHDLDVLTEHIADQDQLAERLAGSQIIVAMRERTPFPATLLTRLPELRLLITTGAKNASIDIEAAHQQGITVCGTGSSADSTAELTLGLMIALSRHFVAEDRAIRSGGWQHTLGIGLSGRTLGVIGLGRLGTKVATLGRALDMKVNAWSPNLTAERASKADVQAVSQQEIFADSDFVSVHMVLSDQTRGLIGAKELALMQNHAYLINTSRGPLVDESALIEALTSGSIAGAGLDVYDTEPLPIDHPLRSTPNTLLLPHLGYVTTANYAVFYRDGVEDIVAFLAGQPIRVI